MPPPTVYKTESKKIVNLYPNYIPSKEIKFKAISATDGTLNLENSETKELTFVPEGFYAFIQKEGVIYVSKYNEAESVNSMHLSLSNSEPVEFAGELHVNSKGIVDVWSNASRHYKPNYTLANVVKLPQDKFERFTAENTDEWILPSYTNPENYNKPEKLWGTGPLRSSHISAFEGQNRLAEARDGLQVRVPGSGQPFSMTVLGKHGDPTTRYLWAIDQDGIKLLPESTPFKNTDGSTATQATHTNITPKASIAGEAWFTGNGQVVINTGSGRYAEAWRVDDPRWEKPGGAKVGEIWDHQTEYGVTPAQWQAATHAWQSLGYKVEAVPLGRR